MISKEQAFKISLENKNNCYRVASDWISIMFFYDRNLSLEDNIVENAKNGVLRFSMPMQHLEQGDIKKLKSNEFHFEILRREGKDFFYVGWGDSINHKYFDGIKEIDDVENKIIPNKEIITIEMVY